MSDEFENMTVAQLKDVLRDRGLPVSGKKAELIARLMEESEKPPVEDAPAIEEDDYEDEEKGRKKIGSVQLQHTLPRG